MCRFTGAGPFSLYIYAVPTSTNATRLIITAASDRRARKAALPIRIMEALGLTRLIGHWTLNRVTDGGSGNASSNLGLSHAKGWQTSRSHLALSSCMIPCCPYISHDSSGVMHLDGKRLSTSPLPHGCLIYACTWASSFMQLAC